MNRKIYHGNFLYAKSRDELVTRKDSYLIVQNGLVEGIYPCVPETYKGLSVEEFGENTIIPSFSDLHVHAPQYVQRGIGMDLLLSDWLNEYTFPLEARYEDMDFAKTVYDAFVDDMVKNGTFHASVLGTIHSEASEYLMKRMEEKGMSGFVGKVNMDMDSPSYLCEMTEESLLKTEAFLEAGSGNCRVRPILTPRFAPTCSRALMEGLGKLAHKYSVGMQTHVVESLWEADQARRLYPECSCDTEIYERYGLMDHGPVIAAHFIFPSKEDISILRKHKGIAVHCPDATVNVIAGIMPLKSLAEQGVRIAIGSDVAAGSSVAVYRQIASAVRLSKLKEFYEPDGNGSISFDNAFYHATREGGSVFGKTGAFEKGYQFNALVIRNMSDPLVPLTPAQSVERFCYAGDDRDICARIMRGELYR